MRSRTLLALFAALMLGSSALAQVVPAPQRVIWLLLEVPADGGPIKVWALSNADACADGADEARQRGFVGQATCSRIQVFDGWTVSTPPAPKGGSGR